MANAPSAYGPSVLADSVGFGDISSLLAARELTEDQDGALIKILKAGVAVEIASLVTNDPSDDVKELAKRAVSIGTAFHWERANYPRQLDQDTSAASTLREAYVGLREELKAARSSQDRSVVSGAYFVSFSG